MIFREVQKESFGDEIEQLSTEQPIKEKNAMLERTLKNYSLWKKFFFKVR